ncbi:MAG: hypothetical protein KF886_10270 [Candidatus Hydrogenedentes bacterium]|nr:hypothetical protein [Candidatus Hydrogenedentota bacterium]
MQATARSVEDPNAEAAALMVVKPDEDGFQVYEPAAPDRVYRVSGTRQQPECTCAKFRWTDPGNPNRPCVHIDAVLRHLGGNDSPPQPLTVDPDPVSLGNPDETPVADGNGNGAALGGSPALLTLKRSVSPDGRIDSLSVEFALPIAGLKAHEVHDFALRSLACQEDIARSFLNGGPPASDGGNGHSQSGGGNGNQGGNGAVPATLRDVGGMQTKWGWRYFINVEADGGVYKLFGNRKQLAEHLADAGHPRLGDQLSKGKTLNVSCLALLEDSEDGRYTNVVELRPANRQQSARR